MPDNKKEPAKRLLETDAFRVDNVASNLSNRLAMQLKPDAAQALPEDAQFFFNPEPNYSKSLFWFPQFQVAFAGLLHDRATRQHSDVVALKSIPGGGENTRRQVVLELYQRRVC